MNHSVPMQKAPGMVHPVVYFFKKKLNFVKCFLISKLMFINVYVYTFIHTNSNYFKSLVLVRFFREKIERIFELERESERRKGGSHRLE